MFTQSCTTHRSRYIALYLALALLACLPLHADPIHSAAQKGKLDKVRALLAADPSLVNSRDKVGMTPLELAAQGDHRDVVEFLLDHGADVNARDSNGGFTAIDLALSSYHHQDVLQLLIAHGANVNTASKQGTTPLEEAAMRGQMDALQLLLSKGAQVNTLDSGGDTALLWALLMGHTDAAKMLIDAGADVNVRDGKGMTPLFVARRHDMDAIEKLLIAHGAHE